MLNKESSAVHFGPHTPLGGMSIETGSFLTSLKSYMFLAAICLQFLLYILIHLELVEMPRDESDKLYGYSLADGSFHSLNSSVSENIQSDHRRLVDIDEEKEIETADIFPSHRYPMGFTLTFIENCYIVLWISKDYFWSWATGDFKINPIAGVFTEGVSILFGVLSVSLFAYVTYCWRHHFVNMMDSLTSFCWLTANLIWMSGEVFIRYGNLQLDDFDQADDEIARLFSGLFFLFGLQIQVIVIFHEMVSSMKAQQRQREISNTYMLEMIATTPTDSRDISVSIHVNE